MSAIFGILHFNSAPVQEALLHTMQNKQRQYGRDGADIFIDGNIGLGCCLSKFGAHAQDDIPVYSDEAAGLTLVCDALLWNRTELVEALGLDGGATTQAILLAAYKTWGANCPNHINGDFAFAVWDNKKQRLFLTRDHMGVRPLYYFWNGKSFAFATDIRAVLCLPFVGNQLNEIQLYALLSYTYHSDPEATYFQQIKRLPQAYSLKIDADRFQKSKYWSPGVNKIRFKTEDEYADALYAIVDDAVKRRIHGVSGGIGAELSGGLDSSVVTVLAAREVKKENKKPYLISWQPSFAAYEKQPRDDREWIERVCAQEGLACEYIGHTMQEERAGGDMQLFNELHLMAGHGVRLILSGWGGDEGISHRANPNELFRRGEWGHFLREIIHAARGNPLRFFKRLYDHTVLPLFAPFAVFWSPGREQLSIINSAFRKKMKRIYKKSAFNFKINPAVHIQSGVIQSRTELSARLDADFSVQHLYPFLDYRVADFAVSIPAHMFYKNGRSRYVFCRAFEQILPEGLCQYPTKESGASSSYTDSIHNYTEKTENTIAKIDRTLFSNYVDFIKLDTFLNSRPMERNADSCIYILRIMRQCLAIQSRLAKIIDK